MPPSYPWDAAPATNEPRGLLLDDLSDGGGRSMASGSSPEAPQSAVGAPVSVYRRPEPHPPQGPITNFVPFVEHVEKHPRGVWCLVGIDHGFQYNYVLRLEDEFFISCKKYSLG